MASPLRVLHVEDEAIAALQMAAALSKLGMTNLPHVATGEAAIRTALKEKPDLILMDIGLAGPMDGIEAAAAIREESAVPIVFITGYEDVGLKERASGVGPLGYLVKPHVMRDLKDILTRNFGLTWS